MEDRRRNLRRDRDQELEKMAAIAMQSANEAKALIASHIKECADNYRKLTMWVIGTLIAGLGGSAITIIGLIVQAHK